MIDKIISFSIKQPFIIILLTLLGIGWGIYSIQNIPLDAIPDLSDPQVIVFTEWKGRSPDIIEDQVTYPIVSSMIAAPKVKTARGYSMFGLSFVYLLYEEGTNLYWARSRTLEYLNKIRNQLPQGVNPTLGPDASGVGWVFEYALVDESGQNSIEDLRSFQDWKLRYLLEAVDGVAEVASVGGFVKQFQIQVDPNALAQYGITIQKIMQQVKNSNRDVGGSILELGEREYFIRGVGYLKSLEDIENITLTATDSGDPVMVKHVANVVQGPEIRRGSADFNGRGEVVSGIVVMRYGEDAYSVIKRIKKVLKSVESSLPEGTKIVATYDRSRIIGNSVSTLTTKLIEEMLVVALVILFFLFHFRSALVPIITLPIAVIFAYIPMYYFGVSSNIMSLGGIAIAIGAMVDAAIILIDNAHKHIEQWRERGKKENLSELLIKSSQEVGRPIFFSLLVIAVSFIPIFTLQGQEGRLFKPLAFTKNFSMFFAAILAITLAPLLIHFLLKQTKSLNIKNKFLHKFVNFFWQGEIYSEDKHPVSKFLYKLYNPILTFTLNHRKKALLIALLLVLSSGVAYKNLGQEFMPTLNEGDILYMPTTLPGISINKAREWMQQQDKLIMQFGEVETVHGKIGRANTATDPAPLSMVETVIQLKHQSDWPKSYHHRWYSSWAPHFLKPVLGIMWPEQKAKTWKELIKAFNEAVQLPGTTNAWVFPIKTRIDMLTTGIRTPIGIKVFGDDLAKIEDIAVKIESTLQDFPGTRSVISERSLGGYYVDIKLIREQLAAYGIAVEDANQLIEGVIGGMNVTTLIDGRARYPVNIRYMPDYRSDLEKLKRSLVTISKDKQIPLMEIASISINKGPPVIKDENGLLTSWVYIDLKNDTDMVNYVQRLDKWLSTSDLFQDGNTYKISGQYEFLLRAKKRMMLVIPLTLLIILLLLYYNTKSWTKTAIVLLAVPFSLVGAFWILYFLNYNLSIAVWVGIIALAGISAETGVIMLLYLDLAFEKLKKTGTALNPTNLRAAIMEGAVKRVRPKIMAVATTFIGLLPIMWAASSEAGADVAKRIAAPMVGGIFTSFLMELLIFPCIYYLWKIKKDGHKSVQKIS
jgi:copper/silver efflux system protein